MISDGARAVLAPLVGDDLDELYAQFREVNPDDHPSLFAVYLKGLKRLTNAKQVYDVTSALENEINLPSQSEEVLTGRFVRIVRIGKGGVGEIRLVHDRELGRNVAYKRLLPDAAGVPEVARSFLHEAFITAQLDHPSIVPIYSLEHEKKGSLAYTMKLVRGKTLSQLVREVATALEQGQAVPPEHQLHGRIEMFLQVCAAIDYAHSRGVVHRDLKPANIMVGPFHEVLVMDWGLASLASQHSEGDERVAGTPGYMSPEQALGEPGARQPASDQFALGLILFELVTLRKAYGSDSNTTLTRARARELAPLEHVAGTPIRRELKGIIDKATAASPADRYPSVSALAEDLRRYLRDEPVLAAPDGLLAGIQRTLARNRGATLAAILALLLLLTVAVFGSVLHARNVAAREHAAAAAREQMISELVGAAASRAGQIDASLSRYAGLLEALAVEFRSAVSSPAEPVPYHLSEGFADPELGPGDLEQVPHYPDPVSYGHLAYKIASPKTAADVEPQLFQLARLKPAFERLLLAAIGPEVLAMPADQQGHMLRTAPSPIIWTYAGHADGIVVKLPGKGGHPADYDPRQRDWYREGGTQPVATWGRSYIDSDGQRLVMPCSMAVLDGEGARLGVVAIDLSVDRLMHTWLDIGRPGATSYVLDGEGTVMISQASKEASFEERRAATFPFPEQLAARPTSQHAGQFKVGDQLVVWSEIPVIGWTYVLTGPTAALLADG